MHLNWVSLYLLEKVEKDKQKVRILEPAMSKIKSLKFASEVAITTLRVDGLIKLNPDHKGGRATKTTVLLVH